MNYIIAALPLVIAAVLDCILGDPYSLPHPIRLIGKLISSLEAFVRRKMSNYLRRGGVFLALTVILMALHLRMARRLLWLMLMVLLHSSQPWTKPMLKRHLSITSVRLSELMAYRD